MTANTTKRYIPALQEIVDGINNYAGRTTKIAPNKIDKSNEAAVLNTIKQGWEKDFVQPTPPTDDDEFVVGALVRLLLKPSDGIFAKKYKAGFSDRTYKITKINHSSPMTFRLADSLTGQKLNGSYYKDQLSIVL